ncbi:hydantoinase B/oxoprolinase family protein [Amycolatopsis sp. FDAARGOS 1241]|uniref:hydantoinase B/oxoprolinase family protein n=1 Tax=Amycolatopsis sp. FDAARGOS 1241 TaxID=2778070 RepID=UPI001950DCEC|nr:hydantoinase B/oxoprolinase family protein [Amycolatopsis sp. FDAARGOS 1241]QRP42950.1 hydantoinase B/oxoprolinase family protein [Amycolatopsis sp. FDAARGOS 1241]
MTTSPEAAGVVWDGVARGYIPSEPLAVPSSVRLHAGVSAAVDPVTFEVVRYSLMNINLEHGQTLQRLCVSPVTMITRDFQPSILTQDGDVVFLGPYLQYFSNSQSLTIKWILENRAEDPGIAPGDMYVSNDPFVGSPHQPDAVVAAPVFVGDEIFCWVSNVLHHSDVGGSVMGSFCVDATDIFLDPPAFPPFKLVDQGKIRPDLEQMFLRQSRVPTNVHMDLRAAISANLVAVDKITKLLDRYGADTVKSVMNRVLDAGERTVAERLAKIPDGTWSHRMYAEAAHTGDNATYVYQTTVRKEGEHLYVDNRGTDPQTGSINVAYAGFAGAFLAALTASLTSDLAGAYGGVYRRVHFEPVPGTLSCADFPAAVSPAGMYTMETLISLASTVIGKMLACAEPEIAELAIGPAHPAFYAMISGGVTAEGNPFIGTNANNMIGSLAASPAGDGVDFGGHFWIPEGTASNVEELELLWPMLYLYRRALPGGADGAGKFRGGRGFVEAAIPWGVPGLAAAVYIDESFPKVVGAFGANPGSVGHFRLKHGSDVRKSFEAGAIPQDFDAIGGAEAAVEAKGPALMIADDGVWEWTGANATGFGDPLAREAASVASDVASGALPADAADRVYGVVLSAGGEADVAATTARRGQLLRERLAEATVPDGVRTVPESAELHLLGGELALVEHEGAWHFVTVSGRALLGPVTANYKDGAAVLERPVRDLGPEFSTHEARAGYEVRYREYLCPVTGRRIETEILRVGDEPLRDMLLHERA